MLAHFNIHLTLKILTYVFFKFKIKTKNRTDKKFLIYCRSSKGEILVQSFSDLKRYEIDLSPGSKLIIIYTYFIDHFFIKIFNEKMWYILFGLKG